ncbi:hypothetical protein Tco_1504891 [Tanacetum coccineum]
MFTERRDASEYECSSSSNSYYFEFQQMAAALEDKMTLTFRNEMNEMKNMMKALVPTPAPIKAVEERCTTCGSNHSFNVCPMTRGGLVYPVYHDNFQQFQQTASVGNFVQNGNSGYRTPNLANQMRPPGFNQPNPQASRPNQGYNGIRLGLPALQSTRMTLELANCSLCVPKGIARDVLVPVGRFTFPADFVVVDFEIIRQRDLISPIPRESKIGKDCDFPLCDDFQSFKTFSNPLFEKEDDFPSRNDESILKEEVHKETLKSYLNPLFEKDEEIISNEASRQISPKVDVKTIVSFFSQIGNCVRKWATNEFVKDNDEVNHEVFKSDNENDLGIHDNKEEEIAFLDGLLEDENFFEINDKKVKSFERKTKEDFETKVELKFKQELQVFHPDIEILNHFETTSYVGSDYVFYEDFNLVDMIFPMNIQGKIFDPGIIFYEKSFENDAFKDKSSKELAPSKALLTLDVFDPLHPPLMDFHVTKAFFGFTFSLLKFFSKKFFEPGIKNATVFRILEDSWFNIVEGQSNAHNFH